MSQETHEGTPPAEPMSAWNDMIGAETPPPTPRSNRLRWLLAGLAVLVLIAAAVIVTALVARPDKPAKGMTQELAVTYVQSEFPGRFPDSAKLITLFRSNCNVLDQGGTRTAAILPMIEGGLSSKEASYIIDISIDSTCPKYRQG